jgi:hypothetical protein
MRPEVPPAVPHALIDNRRTTAGPLGDQVARLIAAARW